MDYLDPRKKKAHRTRLYIGYGLMAIAIAFATVILVYIGSGFYVDRQTGDLIQNGQIMVNSDPEGAQVYLNDKQQKLKTANRLVVPSGSYKVGMKKDGYRDWEQTVLLEGGTVQKLDYARLIPASLKPTIVQTYGSVPTNVSQSPDRKLLSLVFADRPNVMMFYDLTSPDKPATEITINTLLLTDPKKIGSFEVAEWAEDGKTLLIQNKVGDTVLDYILVNRTDAAVTKNLSTHFGLKDAVYGLRERSANSVYIYDSAVKSLSVATINDKQINLRLSGVLQYYALDTNTIVYITPSPSNTSKVQARITDGNDKTYLLRELPVESTPYLLSIAKIGSTVVAAVGATTENKVTVFRNPIGYMKSNPNSAMPLAATVFQIQAPTEVSFSTDASVVMARGGQTVASHYFEEDRTSRYEVLVPLGKDKLRWTDGKHLQAVSEGYLYMFDFDGANLQKLVDTNVLLNAYFDNNYRYLYTFSTTAKPFHISRTQIKLED